jgi:capsular exopolysaccharide synthesis family protein
VGGRRPKSLLVTSALPGEGKSTVAVNLAMTFAGSGYRVLLVDADLRCGVLPELLGARSEPGLADVLKDGKSLAEAIVTTRIPNLSFLPPGRRVNNPGELFLSVEADEFLAQVYRDYDYVVIDSVPVLAADDTTSLAPKVEGIVFVVRGSFTGTRSAQRALEMLHDRQGCVLGAVCNRGADDVPNYNYYAKGRNGANYSLALPQGKRM